MANNIVRVHVTLSKELKELAENISNRNGMTFSSYIAHLVLKDVEKNKIGYWYKDEEASETHIEPIFRCSNCMNAVWSREECSRFCPRCGCRNEEILEEENEE